MSALPAMDRRRALTAALGASIGSAGVIAGAAKVATAAQDAANPELLALETRIKEAHAHFERCFDDVTPCEETCIAWRKENPPPKMRECLVGTNAEYDIWWNAHREGADPESVAHLDPNRDLKAAMAEHAEQMKLWRAHEREVEEVSGLKTAEARREDADDDVLNLCGELGEIPSRSLADLICKARCAKYDSGDLIHIIVADLLAINENAAP